MAASKATSSQQTTTIPYVPEKAIISTALDSILEYMNVEKQQEYGIVPSSIHGKPVCVLPAKRGNFRLSFIKENGVIKEILYTSSVNYNLDIKKDWAELIKKCSALHNQDIKVTFIIASEEDLKNNNEILKSTFEKVKSSIDYDGDDFLNLEVWDNKILNQKALQASEQQESFLPKYAKIFETLEDDIQNLKDPAQEYLDNQLDTINQVTTNGKNQLLKFLENHFINVRKEFSFIIEQLQKEIKDAKLEIRDEISRASLSRYNEKFETIAKDELLRILDENLTGVRIEFFETTKKLEQKIEYLKSSIKEELTNTVLNSSEAGKKGFFEQKNRADVLADIAEFILEQMKQLNNQSLKH